MSVEFKWILGCVAFAAGEAVAATGGFFAPFWPLAVAAAALVVLFGYGYAVRGWPFVFAALAGLALGLFAAARRDAVLDAAVRLASSRPYPATVVVTGEAEVQRGRDGGERMSFPGRTGPVRVRVIWSAPRGAPRPRSGETWLCTGWMAREAPRHANAGRMLWVCGKGTSARRLAGRGRFAALLSRVRRDLSRRVGLGLAHDVESAALNRAILLGVRSRLDPRLRDDFVAAGTVHVFAISGLHVMIVARVMLVLLVLAGFSLRGASVGVVPALWFYTLVIGSPPSAVRAAAMASLNSLAPVCWRRPNGLLAWAFTFLAVYALDPGKLTDVGCGLSFVVMLALVLWSRRAAAEGLDGWRGALGVTAVAWAAGVPIAAHVFGRVTPAGLVTNLVAVPVASCGVVAGVLGVLTSFVSPTAAAHVNNAAALFTRALRGLSHAVATVPGASIEVEPWTFAACSAWYAATAFLLLFPWPLRSREVF